MLYRVVSCRSHFVQRALWILIAVVKLDPIAIHTYGRRALLHSVKIVLR